METSTAEKRNDNQWNDYQPTTTATEYTFE
jgi:hypothetical protein